MRALHRLRPRCSWAEGEVGAQLRRALFVAAPAVSAALPVNRWSSGSRPNYLNARLCGLAGGLMLVAGNQQDSTKCDDYEHSSEMRLTPKDLEPLLEPSADNPIPVSLPPPMPGPTALPVALEQAIRQGRCIAYLGSGFSLPAGLPSFDSLLLEVATQGGLAEQGMTLPTLEEMGKWPWDGSPGTTRKDRMFELQGEIVTRLGKKRASDLFMQQLVVKGELSGEMQLRLDCLRIIPFAFVVTQNWDDLLETRAGYRRVVPSELNNYESFLNLLAAKGSPERRQAVLKFESDGDTCESFLLLQDEIRQVAEDQGPVSARAFWRELLSTHVVVFLGANVKGGYIGSFLREAVASSSSRGCYLPTGPSDTTVVAEALLKTYGVTSLQMPEADSDNHPVDVLLQRLKRNCETSDCR